MKSVVIIIFFIGSMFMVFYSCKHQPDVMPVNPVDSTSGGNNNPVSGGTQPCDPDTVYFKNKVLPLLISSCAKSNCHDAASHQDGVQLTSYQTIMNTADVDPGDPDGSELYRVLNENDPDDIMPRPPNNPLTAAEKAIIYNWILQGARNNACDDCDTLLFTWSGAVLPMINTNCKGCHNPAFLSAGLNLTDYNTVRTIALNGRLMGAIDHLPGYQPMPRGAAKLDECKITQVREWIEAGAPNN